jgi:hypothetical protein
MTLVEAYYCKGNLAVRGNHSGLAREDPKRIYKKDIYMRSVCTTDLAREDPKRIL